MSKRPTHNERVLALLSDGEWHSHHELYALNVIAHSRIADLRAKDYIIEHRRESGQDGSPLYLYRLLAEPSLSPASVSSPPGGIDAAESEAALARPEGAMPVAHRGLTVHDSESEDVASLTDRRGDPATLPSKEAVAPATLFDVAPVQVEREREVWAA